MLTPYRNVALIVAHPDDETMWAGGLLARYGHKIHVLCCSTPSRDKVRADKFFDACAIYGAQGTVRAVLDEGHGKPLDLTHIELVQFDAVVTHNADGEYGHPHHKEVHRFCIKEAAKRKLPVFTFGSHGTARGAIKIKLTAREEELRLRALQCYDHILPYCGRPLPKWQALLERYGNLPAVETYDSQ